MSDYSKPEVLSALAAIATFAIAFMALLVALNQVRITRLEARRSTAHQIYKDYLYLAIQHPQYSSASYPKNAPAMKSFANEPLAYEKYEFYVSYLLFAAEGILEACHDNEWEHTLIDQLRYHALYLQTQDLPENHYSSALLKLREKGIRAYEADDA